MRRVLATLVLLGALGGFVVLSAGAGDTSDSTGSYRVEVDNAFGLQKGADLRIAGVRAGKLGELSIDRRTKRAIVEFEVTAEGFGSLRRDVHCEVRPQSLIGEYFLDCLPGTSKELWPREKTIPVEQTASTVAADLLNNTLRRPYRERLSILLGELGAAAAGNGKNLNDAIRRAAPALRETDKVLKTLADQNRVLSQLIRDGDEVIGDLAANSQDVGRWVVEARDTATASAERRDDIAAGFRKLPEFLARLEPTMEALGRASDAQTPALRNLQRSSGRLRELFDRLGPFADASRPATRSLGRAGEIGRRAAKSAQPVVEQLGRFSAGTPEVGENLARVLEHLNDPAHAVEDDPRAAKATGRARPTGYTGLEALLAYTYDQTLSINVYDQSAHILKVAVQENECAHYADRERIKDEEVFKRCHASLGPLGPGVTSPDPTRPAEAGGPEPLHKRTRRGPSGETLPPGQDPTQDDAPARSDTERDAAPSDGAKKPDAPTLDLPPVLPNLPDPKPVPLPEVGGGTGSADGLRSKGPLLDYLLK